jgi:hypothetical protein
MPTHGAKTSASDLAWELSDWNVGAGIVMTALFPLALPMLVLTLVATIPLLLIGLVGGLAVAVVAAPVVVLWRLGRLATRALRSVTGKAVQEIRP